MVLASTLALLGWSTNPNRSITTKRSTSPERRLERPLVKGSTLMNGSMSALAG